MGLLLCGILHYILDEKNPAELVATLYRALPAGSPRRAPPPVLKLAAAGVARKA